MATKSLNKVMLIGHVGKDPEIRYTNTGTPVASFTMATNESWKDKNTNQVQERTEWHNLVAWNKIAEIFGQYVKKGSRLYIEGRIQTRNYDDKDGNKKYFTEIIVNDFMFLDSAPGGARGAAGGAMPNDDYNAPQSYGRQNQQSAPEPSFEPMGAVDDLPF